MIDPQSQSVLQEIVRRESRSLLSYVADAYPWATAANEPALARLREIVRGGGEATSALGAYLDRRRARTPPLGSYPAGYTSLNFLGLSYIVKRLVKEEERLLGVLEADVSSLATGDERAEAEKLLAVKRQTLEGLRSLGA